MHKAEIRIQYLLNRTTRPKERDPEEIETLENDIKSLKAKYAELIDPTITIYKRKKQVVEQSDRASSQGPDKPNPPKVAPAKSPVVTLFDSIDEIEEGATALPTQVKQRTTECAKCHAPITLSITTDKEQCRQCNTHRDTRNAEEQKQNTSQPLKENQPNENIRRVDPKEEVPPQPPRRVHLPPTQHLAQPHQQVARIGAQAPTLGNIFDDDDDDEMALTNAAVTAWQGAVDRQAEILENGLVFINAQNVKKEIPAFTGEIEGKMTIEEWFKIAERIATHAAWTDEQKLRFFQERMKKSAANFNDSLTAAEKATMQIDDTYRIAYGVNAATSRHADVVALRNETLKDVLLNGLKPQIADLVWNRPNLNDKTYPETVESAEECEKVVEMKKITENNDLSTAIMLAAKESKEMSEEVNYLKLLLQKLESMSVNQQKAEN
ncbi:hypothetical protein DAPPUDRAFT_261545 [Daphnia pulex]|uniref:Uncharacterized protein n=1 Tax=Daphnia pulex TaxID=6669 RepID=E9HL71_DAPPU|nr:hypothetical protein DAPPUDRAFT_261545 [Daphnia pulex]|eukprot:EFX67515.1 hypothetical protein DAPPUDRAFT_261545 [Daphnia pulex]